MDLNVNHTWEEMHVILKRFLYLVKLSPHVLNCLWPEFPSSLSLVLQSTNLKMQVTATPLLGWYLPAGGSCMCFTNTQTQHRPGVAVSLLR